MIKLPKISRKRIYDPITFFSLVGKLKKIPRTGWLLHGIINVESIAEHSFSVTTIAYFLAESLGCNSSKLVKMAIIHDLAEIMTGDIVSENGVITDIEKRKNKIIIERNKIKTISSLISNGKELQNLWEEYENQSSKEAKILKQIDKFEMAMQTLQYENPRNPNHLREFWENAKKYIKHPILLNLFKELCKRRTPPYNDYNLIGKRFL